ncbi:hypothetical protein AZE42_05726 [Rhizopogon vesiculosus]|uniref:Uncharacterized protein n=1 Tax=Rhizopogon vesiculosus TaxID=180088 RepID=A0A1J8RF94_9AGAM|nr:hypothetical protein AZE42_05726 [Rhizopogon vesiculosus]
MATAQVPYIAGRFSFLLSVVLLATQFSPFYTKFNCQGMNTVIMLGFNIAIGCSTTNLMIRTWMIWQTSYALRFLLVLLSLGHWTVLTLFLASARTSTRNGVCMLEYVNPAYADAIVMYCMAYDSLLLAFTIFGLWRMPSSSALWKTLVKQGVMYLIINVIANTVLLVLNRLNLNRNAVLLRLHSKRLIVISAAIMNGIFGTPGMLSVVSLFYVADLLSKRHAYGQDSCHCSQSVCTTDVVLQHLGI